MSQDLPPQAARLTTRIEKIIDENLGKFRDERGHGILASWAVESSDTASMRSLRDAANRLKTKDMPVAFPTETVYGLGADATRSAAVRGIYKAKARPSDNPLIIHISDLDMLRELLTPDSETNGTKRSSYDPIPQIYKPLMERFWPGPLTILMSNPTPSRLAPEVTAGLQTFGVRMPASPLALSLIKLTGLPLAAPSANASTKPSPTTAQHVLEDLDGRIELILDGGSCSVGVESTVVDGLCDPPVVLRPGGVGIDELRSCPGWENVEKAYKDQSEAGKSAPRAPGMKYKHYSPDAMVILHEAKSERSIDGIQRQDLEKYRELVSEIKSEFLCVGIIRTRRWLPAGGLPCRDLKDLEMVEAEGGLAREDTVRLRVQQGELYDTIDRGPLGKVLDIGIGESTRSIAHGLFAALRELDRRGANVIFVEGTVDDQGIGAAVMNRLRKAASHIRS